MQMPNTEFEFLSWLTATLFFPDDLRKELVGLGMDDAQAWMVSRSEAVKKTNLVSLYEDHFRGDEADEAVFNRLIAERRATYDRLAGAQQEQAKAVGGRTGPRR
jgi:hypothetical protein